MNSIRLSRLTVDRPVTTYSLDAVYDMEAAPFFEIASMLSEPPLIASVKVVSDKSGNREPDEAAAEQWLGKAKDIITEYQKRSGPGGMGGTPAK